MRGDGILAKWWKQREELLDNCEFKKADALKPEDVVRPMLVGPKIHVRFGTFVRVRVIFHGYRYFYIYIKKLRVC